MSWNINVKTNTVRVPKEHRKKFEELAENFSEGCLDYIAPDGEICFMSDAMEHMDFLWEDWVSNFQKEIKLDGDVVFMSAEGDNSGDIWGYRFKPDGTITRLSAKVVMIEA